MVVPNIRRGGPGTPVTLHVGDLPCPHQLFFFQFVQVDCWRGSKSSLWDIIFWYSLIAKSLPVDCKNSQGTLHWGRLLRLATPCIIFDGCCTHEKLQLSRYNQLHRCLHTYVTLCARYLHGNQRCSDYICICTFSLFRIKIRDICTWEA